MSEASSDSEIYEKPEDNAGSPEIETSNNEREIEQEAENLLDDDPDEDIAPVDNDDEKKTLTDFC